MNLLSKRLLLLLAACVLPLSLQAQANNATHTLAYAPGKSITLSLPETFDINVAASGLHRVRFFAQAPDGRIFVTGMYNLADNTQGSVFVLDGWNEKTHTFAHVTHYLDHLRNPNNLAFWTDPSTHQMWLYLPLTDRLERYKYNSGDNAPSSPPQVLIRYPDYGLNYKYGGWHLTRTVAVATLHGHTRIYVAAGSSCNYCREHEVIRASLSVMDPDGSHQQLLAHGLRNAVDLRFIPGLDGGSLFASNMGDDHLGDTLPEDSFFELDSNAKPGAIAGVQPGSFSKVNYGWPTCYFAHGKPTLDTTALPENPGPSDPEVADRPVLAKAGTLLPAGGGHASTADPNADLGTVPEPLTSCKDVPAAYTTFAAHSSPLGMAYFGDDSRLLHDSFLVALHGAGHQRIGTGYRLTRFTPGDRTPRDFLTGFLTKANGKPVIHGRPCGLLQIGPDSFLLTDDYLGLVYFIHPKS
ncbi:MAG TPA: hypothetical protein VGG18_05820 [Granulicella sp.]|jgi:glucose/arabinose dehydrogenase